MKATTFVESLLRIVVKVAILHEFAVKYENNIKDNDVTKST